MPDVSHVGFQAFNQAKNVIEEYPGFQNIPMTGRKAATHITAIQEEFSLPVINIVENLEEQVFNPWLKKAFMRNQQFLDDTEIFLVTGKKGLKHWLRMKPEMLVGDYNFYWRGANQATMLHVKSKQMDGFLNTAIPFIPLLAQEGKKLNVGKILQRMWKEGMDLDGADEIIEDAGEDRSVDPQTENILLSLGKYIPVSPIDNDQEHIPSHQQVQLNPQSQSVMMKHIEGHIKQAKIKEAAMQVQTQRPRQQGMEGQGEVPGERTLEGEQPVGNQ
jgi:hypothetical protein